MKTVAQAEFFDKLMKGAKKGLMNSLGGMGGMGGMGSMGAG